MSERGTRRRGLAALAAGIAVAGAGIALAAWPGASAPAGAGQPPGNGPAARSGAEAARSLPHRAAPRLGEPEAQRQIVRATAALTGLLLLFEYDPARTVSIDTTGNGAFEDPGDRLILQGRLWLSDRSARRREELGEFASVYDYLAPSGEATGTDLVVTTDLRFIRAGQVRVGGFWNVEDGIGAPAIGVLGTAGSSSLKRYERGQLVFLSRVSDTEELYLLGR